MQTLYEDIHKRTIQEPNYNTPPSHVTMYISSSTSITTTTTTTTYTKPTRLKTTLPPTFIIEFSGLEDICDLNECNYWLVK